MTPATKKEQNKSKEEQLCLFFIFTFSKGAVKTLKIEAARSKNKSVGPFLRGAKFFSRLEDCLRDEDIALLDSLRSIGMNTLPFSVPETDFKNIPIREWFFGGGLFFKKMGAFGSLRPIIKDRIIPEKSVPAVEGTLTFPVVYLHLSVQRVICRLRFQYSGLSNPVGVFPSSMPLRSENGVFFLRDQAGEQRVFDSFHRRGVRPDTKGKFFLSIQQLNDLIKKPPLNAVFLAEKAINTPSSGQSWTISGIKWFGEDTDVNSTDFLDAYLENRNYVQLDGTVGLFEREAIARRVEKDLYRNASASDPVRHLLSLVVSILEKKNNEKDLSSVKLRPYLKDWQARGVNWLLNMKSLSAGAILADEMGLGKTIQTIAFLSVDWETHKTPPYSLIVAPASVVDNWKNEICRFEPMLTPYVHCPVQLDDCSKSGFIILSYERAVRQIRFLEKISFENIVFDEAQKVKNANTISYKELLSLRSNFRMMLTGTPIENTISELWNHVALVNPMTLGSMLSVRARYPVLDNTQKFTVFSLNLLSNFVLIRRKRDVNINLPPLTESVVKCRMESAQRVLYESIRKKFLSGLKSGISVRIPSLALEALLRLRQCCCLPEMLPVSLNPMFRKESCKLDVAFRIVLDEMKQGRKVLVFSQFLEVLRRFETMLLDVGVFPYVLTGDTNTFNRQELVDAFNNDSGIAVFLISLKAGGIGMNLAKASCVILFDPWWNPAVEKQAFARAHRIGQRHPVDVFKLICENTVEEKVLELENKKQKLASGLVSADRLSLVEMMDLLS